MRTPLIIALAALITAGPAGAQDDDNLLRLGAIAATVVGLTEPQKADVVNNFASETAVCVAYYEIVDMGLQRRSDFAGDTTYTEIIAVLVREGLALMDLDVFMARFEFLMSGMLDREMRNDFARISVLVKEYGALCKEHVEDPGARVDYWIEKRGYHGN